MVKIKIIKEGLIYPIGKIINVSKKEAKEAVENNSAEYVNETFVKGVGFIEEKKEVDKKGQNSLENENRKITPEEASYYKSVYTIETHRVREDILYDGVNFLVYFNIPREHWERYKKEHPEKFSKKEIIREQIELPDASLISEFAKKLVDKIKLENILFYRQDSRQVIELGDIKEGNKIIQTGFINLEPSRFVTLIERYFIPWTYKYSKFGKFKIEKSMNTSVAKIVLESQIFQENLPIIKRIFPVQIPIIFNNKLTFPEKGYDIRFNSWLPYDAPEISNIEMPLEEAKKIIYEIFKEFCFESHQDYINSISALLTPFLKGLFKTGFNTRTPVYIYEANRERSGKDYLAGIIGVLYEGHALEEPPISNGEKKSSGANDELRKKIVSAMLQGRRRLHFSNNKGYLNNSVFESVTTAEKYSDRLLGKNTNVTLDNELDFSLSGNIGITLTPDLANRSIFIRLFLDIEDANQREFEKPTLHKWVLDNRNLILSALYSLVKKWFDKGMPQGSKPFTSFPEWANVCGGIMECAGYENPCISNKNNTGIAIDSETEEMKELFEICYKNKPEEWLIKDDIKKFLTIPGETLMSYFDFESKSSQTKFGLKLNKYVGRILSDIKLIVEDKTKRSNHWRYKFTKIEVKNDKESIFRI